MKFIGPRALRKQEGYIEEARELKLREEKKMAQIQEDCMYESTAASAQKEARKQMVESDITFKDQIQEDQAISFWSQQRFAQEQEHRDSGMRRYRNQGMFAKRPNDVHDWAVCNGKE